MIELARDYHQAVTLKDGSTLLLRALQHSDKPLIVDLFRQLSPKSIRYRAFAAKGILTEKELTYLVDVDFVNHVALAAVFRGAEKERIVGVGRYCRAPLSDAHGPRAEVAFTVLDEEQGRGIGTLLLEHLAGIARSNGVDEFEADIMIGNTKMMEVFAASGFVVRKSLVDGVHHVLFPTKETTLFLEASRTRHSLAAANQASSQDSVY
ncbi:MAG: GNAT family N-acetyltransferase [Polyangiaceae bacterium]